MIKFVFILFCPLVFAQSLPEQTTYFICREDETYTIVSHGSVEPQQTMNTGQPIVDTYLYKAEWEAKLLEGGITIEENEEVI